MKKIIRSILKIIFACGACAVLLALIFIRNPIFIRQIDARQETSIDLESIYSEVSPYVYLKHVDLDFTGYYSVSDKGEICSYCFIGQIGDHSYFIELSADKVHAAADNAEDGLKDFSLLGKMRKDESVIRLAAEEEKMTAEAYLQKYDICAVGICQYHSDFETTVIFYILALLGLAVIGIAVKMLNNTNESKESL